MSFLARWHIQQGAIDVWHSDHDAGRRAPHVLATEDARATEVLQPVLLIWTQARPQSIRAGLDLADFQLDVTSDIADAQ